MPRCGLKGPRRDPHFFFPHTHGNRLLADTCHYPQRSSMIVMTGIYLRKPTAAFLMGRKIIIQPKHSHSTIKWTTQFCISPVKLPMKYWNKGRTRERTIYVSSIKENWQTTAQLALSADIITSASSCQLLAPTHTLQNWYGWKTPVADYFQWLLNGANSFNQEI